MKIDTGLLVLRVGMGVMFVLHGFPKLMGGPERWTKVGSAMESLGIHFAPTFWGLMAGLSECVGGVLIALGLLTRPTCAVLVFTMIIAALKHLSAGDPFARFSHPIEAGIVFIALAIMGPGRHSLDARLFARDKAASAPH
jgi:putative oxidoreductase